MILLSPEKIDKIKSNIINGCNFLIFGTGNDSDYWRKLNNKGYNLFLEDDPLWIPKDSVDVLKINYTQNCNNYKTIINNKNFKILKNPLANKIDNIKWDYILVDGPKGWINKTNHGRMESIYLAYELSNEKTTIFIDDIERPIENLYGNYFFTIVEKVQNLAVCHKRYGLSI